MHGRWAAIRSCGGRPIGRGAARRPSACRPCQRSAAHQPPARPGPSTTWLRPHAWDGCLQRAVQHPWQRLRRRACLSGSCRRSPNPRTPRSNATHSCAACILTIRLPAPFPPFQSLPAAAQGHVQPADAHPAAAGGAAPQPPHLPRHRAQHQRQGEPRFCWLVWVLASAAAGPRCRFWLLPPLQLQGVLPHHAGCMPCTARPRPLHALDPPHTAYRLSHPPPRRPTSAVCGAARRPRRAGRPRHGLRPGLHRRRLLHVHRPPEGPQHQGGLWAACAVVWCWACVPGTGRREGVGACSAGARRAAPGGRAAAGRRHPASSQRHPGVTHPPASSTAGECLPQLWPACLPACPLQPRL